MWWGRNWNLLAPSGESRPLPELGTCPEPCAGPSGISSASGGQPTGQGAQTRMPITCPLCTEQACSVHVPCLWGPCSCLFLSPWPNWKEKMTKSVFFLNEMLLLEVTQAGLVIVMSGPQGVSGPHLQALVPSAR